MTCYPVNHQTLQTPAGNRIVLFLARENLTKSLQGEGRVGVGLVHVSFNVLLSAGST